jgi:hypothetical protein
MKDKEVILDLTCSFSEEGYLQNQFLVLYDSIKP